LNLRTQRGFTLMEVLVSVLVFAISIVGLVALESRAIESQKASAQLREGERVAQDVLAELQARGFLELVAQDFSGNANPSLPYDDSAVATAERLRHYRRPPADIDEAASVVGTVRNQYLVVRAVDWVIDAGNPPANPPDLAGTDGLLIRALVLDVTVLWLDDTNPMFPPPANLSVTDLTAAMTRPDDPEYRPYVGYVTLRTVRINDASLAVPEGFE
jgi:prepilin-type N-terminal cleavage/methylation domain-containing protein